MHLLDPREGEAHQGVTHLMVRHHLALLRIQQAVALLQASDDPLHGFVEIRQGYRVGAAARGQERRFIDKVGEVSARKAGR